MEVLVNKWKVAFFFSFILFLISSFLLVFLALDNGTSYTYLKVSLDEQVSSNKVLGNLIVKGGQEYTQKDLLHLLRLEYPKEFIVEEGDIIKMNANSFEFHQGKLVKVW